MNQHGGRVSLVGAGPGDPELLTIKALRVLAAADVVLFDDLVSPAVLALNRATARRLHVGKRGYRTSCTQSAGGPCQPRARTAGGDRDRRGVRTGRSRGAGYPRNTRRISRCGIPASMNSGPSLTKP